ncbi:MAG TPA: AAA family ATPase, partial [Rhodothermales bacterium]|nr:AAA family ATPase [Rhodothermales bacterium]
GRATFLVLDRLPEAPAKPAPEKAGVQPMQGLLEVSDPAYEPLATLLLRDCYSVSSLTEGREQAHTSSYPARFFAPTGEWVDARGFERAGSEQSSASPVAGRMKRREQLDKARAQLEDIKILLDQRRETASDLRETLEALPLETHRQDLATAKQAYTEADRALTRLQIEEESLLRRQADMEERVTNLEQEHREAEAATDPLEVAVEEADRQLATLQQEREAAEATFLTTESESRAAQDRFSEANVAAVEARNRYDNLQRDIARTHQDLETRARRAEERRDHLDTLQTTIDTAQQRLDALTEELDEIRSQRDGLEEGVSQAKSALLQIKVDIDQVEFRLRKLRQARESAIHEVNTRAVRLAENETRTEDLLASIEEAYSRNLAESPIEIESDFDVKAARADVQDLRQSLKNLGSINALALEEYEEEKERFEFMTAQKEDLEQAEETLLETIDEINTTAAARFNETFEAIRMSFRGLFAELFGQDATADLALEDEDDPLESAISIMAKPRGKRPVSIAQLSSGEKTLTAIALLFAIYLVKPSPFCILDEVDAPLDDANIDRFMRLIRRFSENTQFILVTHNKRTMELADRLYGITMQEQGISRLVGVKFDEALEMAG